MILLLPVVTSLFLMSLVQCEMVPTLTPTFLRYNKNVRVVFTLEPPCNLVEKNLILNSQNSHDDQIRYWQTVDPNNRATYFSRPDSSTILIDGINYSHDGTFFVTCISSETNYKAKLTIPVMPHILKVNVAEGGGLSTLKNEPTFSEDGYRSYYEFSAFFDDETALAKLQIDVGEGVDSTGKTAALLPLTGDTGIISRAMATNLLNYEPNYPNGTSYSYIMDSTKWSEMPEPKCVANLTARTEIASSSSDLLWHEAFILMELNYRPQKLRLTATTSKSTTCEIACEVNSACPYVDVIITLELFDENNRTIAKNSVKTSRSNRVTVNIQKLDTCHQLVTLAKSRDGLAVCSVSNAVGIKRQEWHMGDVNDLAALLLSDEFTFNWWEILLIVLSCLFFVVIVAFIIGCIVYKRQNSTGTTTTEKKRPSKFDEPYTVPPLTAQPAPAFFQQQLPVQQYQMQPTITQLPQQARPFSQAGSSYYTGGRLTGEFDSPYTQLPADAAGSDYRVIQFTNTPRSRQPIIAGPPPAPTTIPAMSNNENPSYDNPAFMRTPAAQRSFREAIV